MKKLENTPFSPTLGHFEEQEVRSTHPPELVKPTIDSFEQAIEGPEFDPLLNPSPEMEQQQEYIGWMHNPKGSAPAGLFDKVVPGELFNQVVAKALGDRTNMSKKEQDVYDVLVNGLKRIKDQQGIQYSPNSKDDFDRMDFLAGSTKLDKKIQKQFLQKLSDAGILAQIPRQETPIKQGNSQTTLGVLKHYRLERDTLLEGQGNATIDKGTLANLAQFTPTDGGPSVLRHAKAETKKDWDGVRQLAARRSEGDATAIEKGDKLAPAIYRYDQKTPSWLNSHENKMAKTEREAAQESNRSKPNLPKVHTFGMTANGLVDLFGGLVHRLFIKGSEQRINEPATRDKALRSLIEIARSDAGQGGSRLSSQEVQELTKQFNAYSQSGDKTEFENFLKQKIGLKTPEQDKKAAFYHHLLGVSSGSYSLNKIGDFMRRDLTDVRSEKGQAIRDNLTSILTGKNAQGKKLSRSAELALHTALDQSINVDSDAGCKSGQDRTLHLFATTLAGRDLTQTYGDKNTSAFLQNFDALAQAYDRIEDPAGFQKFRSPVSREADFNKLAQKSGLDAKEAKKMIEQYRQSYYDSAIKTGLPITEYSTLLPGMKWHNEKGGIGGFFAENRLPINYLPKQIKLDNGNTVDIMKRGAFGRRIFTPEGIHLIKGLARFRET